jgi:glycerate 2-kinase
VRVVIAPGSFGEDLGPAAAAEAIATGWRRTAPADELVLGTPDAAALDGAGLVVTGEAAFDWRSLRDSVVTEVARAATERGVPCVVMAGRVSVGRREAGAIGVDAAYAVGDPGGGTAALADLAETVARSWSR